MYRFRREKCRLDFKEFELEKGVLKAIVSNEKYLLCESKRKHPVLKAFVTYSIDTGQPQHTTLNTVLYSVILYSTVYSVAVFTRYYSITVHYTM